MNQPSLLLINPWIYDFALYDFWARPLGLMYLAGLLKLRGYKINYLDCLDRHYPGLDEEPGLIKGKNHQFGTGSFHRQKIPKPSFFNDIPRYYYRYGISQRLFLEALNQAEKPESILVTSGMTYWYPGAFEVIRQVKRKWPDTPVILGGIYATLCPEHARKFSGADFVIEGPGEDRILLLLEEITGLRVKTLLKPDTDFHGFPYPAFDLMRRLDYVCLLTSRGCPFRCSYCASHLLSKKFVRRSPDSVVKEILYWHENYGVKDFAFYDDALLLDADRHIVPILQAIIEAGIVLNLHTPNGLHARFIDANLAKLLFRAGFRAVRLGVETVSHRPDNKVTFEEFQQAVAYLREAGFNKAGQIIAYLMMGMPGQRPEEVEEAVRMVQKAGAKAYLSEYSPIPGTELWEKAVSCSRYDLAKEPLTHNNSVIPCLSEKFTWEDVRRLKEMRKY